MKTPTTHLRFHLSLTLALCSLLATYAQDTPTYTVDPNFTTGNLFRDYWGISSLVLYDDGRILAGGGFTPFPHWSPFVSLGMVWADGSEFLEWGGGGGMMFVTQVAKYQNGFIAPLSGGFGKFSDNGTPFYIENGHAWIEYLWEPGLGNPYNVKGMWCVYVQEDDKVLIGGAVATDTTQPDLYRNLMRVLPDGSHDTTFPAIEIEPNIQYTAITKIHKDSQGRWIVSGDFWAVNGHETAYVATAVIHPEQIVGGVSEQVDVFAVLVAEAGARAGNRAEEPERLGIANLETPLPLELRVVGCGANAVGPGTGFAGIEAEPPHIATIMESGMRMHLAAWRCELPIHGDVGKGAGIAPAALGGDFDDVAAAGAWHGGPSGWLAFDATGETGHEIALQKDEDDEHGDDRDQHAGHQ